MHALPSCSTRPWWAPETGVILAVALLLGVATASAQTVQLDVLLPNAADMPRTLGEWEEDPSIVQVIATNLGPSPIGDLRFSFTAEGARRGLLVSSDDASPAQPRLALAPGESRVFLWDEVVSADAVDIVSGLRGEVSRDGIPEDQYQLCATLLDPAGASVSGPVTCRGFLVYEPDPPQLVYPTAGTPVAPETVTFQWAPSQSVNATYRLTVVPRFAGQTTVEAIEANPILFEREVAEASYLVLPSDPPWDTFPGTVGFVWQVQQFVNGRPDGRDEGLSQAEPFVIYERPDADDPFATRDPLAPDTTETDSLETILFVGAAADRGGFAWRARPSRTSRQPTAVRLSGRATASVDVYSESGLPRPRRPGTAALLNGQVTATIGGLYTIPLSFHVSTEDAGYQLPFNQVGFSPTIGWATFHGGYFSTRLSEFTLGDARLLGGGIELNPGPLRLAVVSGLSQQAIRPDEAGRRGLFDQVLTAAQLGAGSEGGWHLWLTALRAEDQRSSLPEGIRRLEGVRSPQENLVASVRMGMPLWPGKIDLTGEVAASAHSDDTFASRLNIVEEYGLPDAIEDVFTPRSSSRVDAAAEAALRIQPVEAFSLNLRSRYVGPGFQSLGASQLEVDVFDVLVNPQVQGTWGNLDVSVGLRQNDVAGTRLFGTQRTIVNASGTVRPATWASLAAQFSNYGLRSSTDNDTLRIENVSRLISVTPGVQFTTGRLRHAARVSGSFQSFEDENIVTGRLGDTENYSGTLSYTLAWPSGLSLTTSATGVRGLTSSINTTILSVSQAVGYAFFDRKLRTSLSISVNQTETTATDRGLQSRLRLSYRVTRRHRLEASAQLRAFDYGVTRNGSDGFSEVLTRFSYSLSL